LNVLNALNVFKHLKCALRRFKCFRRLKRGFRRLRWDPDSVYAQAIREKLVTQSFNHLQSIHSRCSDTEVCSLMFLANWLDRRSANGREGAPLFTSFQVLTAAKGGDLEQRWRRPWYASLSYARSTIWSTDRNKYNIIFQQIL